jgi:formamidopyrimidine-DNA glycosylase
MPEGPEIKKYTDYLRGLIQGKSLKSLNFIGGRYVNEKKYTVQKEKKLPDNYSEISKTFPSKIFDVKCKGKFQYWLLEHNFTIWITHGMTGKFSCHKTKYSHIKFVFLDGFVIYFNDVRRFGTIKFESYQKLEKKLNKLGPDILTRISDKQWLEIMEKKKDWTLPKLLLNQRYISGIGNYLKAEALYLTKLSPVKKTKSVPKNKLVELKKTVQKLAKKAYKSPGGLYFQCYGRKTTDKNETVKAEATDDKRTTYWVPDIQK